MSKLDLNHIDVDGAIGEAAEAAGIDRRNLLRKGAIGAGGLVAGSAFFGVLSPAEAAISTKKRSKKNDVKILNFALTLEFLEAEFYAQALSNKVYGDNPQLQKFTEVVAVHEAKHVTFLRDALRSAAIKKPSFDFGAAVTDRGTYQRIAQTLEDTGVSAYLGQAGNISQKSVLGAAGSIVTVEARHASWIRFINSTGGTSCPTTMIPAPATFDSAKSERTILKAVTGTGFIQ